MALPVAHRVAVAAPAKINLYLHVLGRRADGYHLLDSLVAFTACGDRIEATTAADVSLAINGPFAAGLSTGEDNLVMRAARALGATARDRRGAAIRLVKNLPVASGIGGGSADAAATLRALDALWGLHAGAADLARIGLTLGADVPVCLFGHTARMGGVGEAVAAAAPLPDFGVVLANPGIPVATGAVFEALAGRYSAPPRARPPGARTAAEVAAWLRELDNDLAAPAAAIAPQIAQVLDAIGATRRCLLARLSGSGGTCFGLYPSAAAAVAAANQLRADHAGWWVVDTSFIASAPTVEAID